MSAWPLAAGPGQLSRPCLLVERRTGGAGLWGSTAGWGQAAVLCKCRRHTPIRPRNFSAASVGTRGGRGGGKPSPTVRGERGDARGEWRRGRVAPIRRVRRRAWRQPRLLAALVGSGGGGAAAVGPGPSFQSCGTVLSTDSEIGPIGRCAAGRPAGQPKGWGRAQVAVREVGEQWAGGRRTGERASWCARSLRSLDRRKLGRGPPL